MRRWVIIMSMVLGILYTGTTEAQTESRDSSAQVVKTFSRGFHPTFSMKGLLQVRHSQHLDLSSNAKGVFSERGSFGLRRARIKLKGQLHPRWSAFAMADLAHFTRSPMGPVLETYWVRYRHSEALQLTGGLFRPSFGLEDQYIGDVMETIDWSQQYSAFGRSGWQSFHYGITAGGSLREVLPLPFDYAVGIYHNKNFNFGKDGNYAYGRLSFEPMAGLQLGLNGAVGNAYGQAGSAYAIDLQYDRQLGRRWSFHLEAEFKEGSNMQQFCEQYDLAPASARLGNCRMRGWLLLPNLRYRIGAPWLQAVAVSLRTEWFDEQMTLPEGRRIIYTPHLSLEWAADYAIRLQVAVVNQHDLYPAGGENAELLTQLQLRF